ncbi:hypothetical protein [Nonomuraea sp. NPDC049400]|uniref:hypothetical protein n=1 Tax=Nonomuraea sp. NPDC049400 TaxID=3364352 RepID=UPI00379E41E4
MATNRSRQLHNLARTLTRLTGVQIEASYPGPRWELRWRNGPTSGQMRTVLAKHAPAGVPADHIDLSRDVGVDAIAMQAIRLALAGKLEFDRRRHAAAGMSLLISDSCRDLADPERGVNDRQAAMAQRLLQASGGDKYAVPDLLLQHDGVEWLLPEPALDDVAGDPHFALEVLTARYATGAAAAQWRRRLATLDENVALAAARADAAADAVVDLAVLAVAAAHRARILAALDAERLADLNRARGRVPRLGWPLIGRALGGISRQAAQQEHDRLKRGAARRRPAS